MFNNALQMSDKSNKDLAIVCFNRMFQLNSIISILGVNGWHISN